MASHQGNSGWRNAPVNEAATGIEDHLRNLILTHGPPNQHQAPAAPDLSGFPRLEPPHRRSASERDYPMPPSGPSSTGHSNANFNSHGNANAASHAVNADADVPGQHFSSSPKAAKRRPNQAQRRQMNAQLSITPDSQPQRQAQRQPQAQSPYQGQGGNRPTPHYQRHMPTFSHPSRPAPSPAQWRGYDHLRGPDSWRGPRQPPTHLSRPSTDFSGYPAAHFASPAAYPAPGPGSGLGLGSGRGHRHAPSGNAYPMDSHRSHIPLDVIARQANYLELLCHPTVSGVEINREEIAKKESFRQRIEEISRHVLARYEMEQHAVPDFPALSVQLKCFGSLASGFATKGSDMDLGLLSPRSQVLPDAPGSPIPRLLEKAFLDAGLGARLLSRTRVPIIKLCEQPPEPLRLRLIDARARWEAGLDNERPEGLEDEPEHDNPSRVDDADDEQRQEQPSSAGEAASPGDFQVPCHQTGELQQFQLQQKAKGALSSYRALANRVLRRAGGRDINAGNYRKFSTADWEILNRVCHAFINGLSDARLRERITRYPSLRISDKPQNSYYRSLASMMTQVEGEQILQAWDDWPDRALFEDTNPRDDQILRDWTALQYRSTQDFLTFARDLEVTLQKIKTIPAIRLLLLEQEEQESHSQYLARVEEIRPIIGDIGPETERVIVSRYVSGINPGDVREAVAAHVAANPDQAGLQSVACRHRSLSLARDLERALTDKLFEADEVASILRYVEGLRSPLVQSPEGSWLVPLPPDSSAAISALKVFEDLHGTLLSQAPSSKYRDPLEFPKNGVGVQCDINFSAHLALHNTALLRCYALTDPRVKPMALFVKHWARARGINSGYRGTLSSYGYVLMVLHYLVHVAQPFVCPNLQKLAPTAPPNTMSPAEVEATTMCNGYDVRFWRNEQEILQLAVARQLNQSTASLGELLRGFFEYFANNGPMSTVPRRGFDWGRDVLSLRTHGGLVSKQKKGWTGAKTVFADEANPADVGQAHDPNHQAAGRDHYQSQQTSGATTDGDHPPKTEQKAPQAPRNHHVKEIRLRYLLAIEDPFEVDHNVARTVTHNGIVSIRDEFRRAWRIVQAAGNDHHTEELLEDVKEAQKGSDDIAGLLRDIHGADCML